MELNHRHDWNVDATAAVALQKELAAEIIADRPLDVESVRLVAGVDVSVKDDESGTAQSQAAVVVLSYPELKVVETQLAKMPTPFPYIPGLLAFREGPVLVTAFEQLEHTPDVFIFDGMGRAHPRRIGIASMMGLWLQKPTIGCGKTRLVGKHADLPEEKGSAVDLVDKHEVIGQVVRTRTNVKPVYISPGHLIDLPSAVDFTMHCLTRYRLPEPIRAAHNAAGSF
ncbi:MAG: deoxyribonuclease V [Chloroflexi bacterium]|nr:deoxyribonuclease V [Chloroflexota bacterium]